PVMRERLLLLSAALAVFSSAGCVPGQSDAWPTTPAPDRAITVLTGVDESADASGVNGIYQQLANWWNDSRNQDRWRRDNGLDPGYSTITFVQVRGGATAVHSQMLASAQENDSNYDVYNLDNQWVPEFAAAGYVRSLEKRNVPQNGFLKNPLSSAKDASGRLF